MGDGSRCHLLRHGLALGPNCKAGSLLELDKKLNFYMHSYSQGSLLMLWGSCSIFLQVLLGAISKQE